MALLWCLTLAAEPGSSHLSPASYPLSSPAFFHPQVPMAKAALVSLAQVGVAPPGPPLPLSLNPTASNEGCPVWTGGGGRAARGGVLVLTASMMGHGSPGAATQPEHREEDGGLSDGIREREEELRLQ